MLQRNARIRRTRGHVRQVTRGRREDLDVDYGLHGQHIKALLIESWDGTRAIELAINMIFDILPSVHGLGLIR